MKIIDILNSGKVTVSAELFPPKHGAALDGAKSVVRQTAELAPSFISITCGAGGGTNTNTVGLADEAQNACGVTALAHLVCIAAKKQEVKATLTELAAHKIENILALRGDMPKDTTIPTGTDYRHASDLMRDIRDFGGF